MIIESMNKLQVFRHFMAELKESISLFREQNNSFAKALKKLPKGNVTSVREWENRRTKQKYISIMSSTKGVSAGTILANVLRGKNTWYYCFPTDLTDTMDAYSVHFFKRYAERTYRPYLMPKIMCAYFGHNCNSVKIYQDKTTLDAVYASNEGLSLCRFDKANSITLHATFISKEMLKPYQREAFDFVLHKIEEADKTCSSLVDKGPFECYDWKEDWIDSLYPITKIANEIYGQYYDELNERELCQI